MSTDDIKPLISIVLPVFNNGFYLSSCLDSLFSQSYKNLEIIAVDDFSRDDSVKILKAYKQTDKRIRIYRNVKHYGKALTFNRALRRVKGDYIVFMDPEDIVYKDKLKKQLTFLLENPKVAALGTQCTYINSTGKRLGKSEFPHEQDTIYHKPLHGVSVQFQTLIINKRLLPKDLLWFNTNGDTLLYSELLIKILQFGTLVNLPHPPLQYHRQLDTRQFDLNKYYSLTKFWVNSILQHDYRPSFRYLYNALFRNFTAAQ